ncbi:site-specific DNA-methyltransferase [Xylanibacter rarus]|uniref:site-specific DNA-methyltransferase n=1 Tax=Xylanibacter rarus TaxID=1676614 RepID=UPI003FF099C8
MNNKNYNIYPVGAIKHDEEQRASIPTTELAGEESLVTETMTAEGQYKQFKHDFDRGRDPELYWLGKYKNDNEDTQSPDLRVDTRSLYRHEEINPEMLINQLYTLKVDDEAAGVASLFGNELPPTVYEDELQRITEYYRHNEDWRNRLIQGDSLLVMNSLLQREGMAGRVQMIYIDPPYGIKYGSNWQMKLNNRDVKDNDESLSGEPEMIKAFRDTWELGIHSYLSYLRDRLVLARELLTESGSCFVQISDDNMHLVRCLMDEVFGSENFFSLITFKKTLPLGSSGLAGISDYIIWYAKNIENIKYRQLFEEKPIGVGTGYTWVELENGTRRKMTSEERNNPSLLPQKSKVFFTSTLSSSGYTPTCMYDIELNGKIYKCGKKSWRTHKEGMQKLIAMNRVMAPGNLPCYILYHDDFPYQELNNLWDDTHGATDIQYVCQTSIKPIQRCMLMCTDPGDLVLDPTCGSGTTAYVAEQWGRRWITIDTSRIALNIAKKRLTTAVFPYYELFDKENGNIRQGFVYKTVPHITLKSLANDLEPDEEILYDQPKEDKKKIRVAGPFTVETLQSFNVVNPDDIGVEERNEAEEFQEQIFAHLKSSGIRNGAKDEQAIFYNLEAVANPYLNAKGYYKDAEGKERLAYFHIGPKFGTVSKRAVSEALKEFRPIAQNEGASWLCILGFSFEDNINEKDYNLGLYTVSKVRMHDDLMQDGLLKKDKGAGAFITIGEPDIAIVEDEGGKTVHVEIQGLDIYDPIKDIVKPRSVEDIAYWEIDDNYNGEQFIVRGLHFCGGSKKEFNAWRKGLQSVAPKSTKKKAEVTLRLNFNEEVWDTLYGFQSQPIEKRKGRKIAVRVISQFGEESTKVLTI